MHTNIPICRLLATLNDDDLPLHAFFTSTKIASADYSFWFIGHYFIEFVFFILCVFVVLPISSLPKVLEEAVLEALISALIGMSVVLSNILLIPLAFQLQL
jgi:hypothetical protein